MDTDSTAPWPNPKPLKTLAFNVVHSKGNNLLHQFVLDNSDPHNSGSENYINAVLLSLNSTSIDVNACNAEGYSPLHLAVLKNNVIMVKKLLSCLVDIDVNSIRTTVYNCEDAVLHTATKLGRLSIIQELLNNGADVDITNRDHSTALSFAAMLGDLNIMELLVSKGANVNTRDKWGTPLHYAAEAGKVEAVKFLVSKGAAFDALDYGKESILHYAVRSGDVATVEFLVSIGANLNDKNFYGWTPLCYAAQLGNLDLIERLLNISEKFNNEIETNRDLLLLCAAQSKDLNTMQFFIEKGADVNAKGKDGYTPLHWACYSFDKLEIMELLYEKGCDVNAENGHGETPLHIVVHTLNLEYTQWLLEKGANVNVADGYGWTPLHIAAHAGDVEITKLLLCKGADKNARNKRGKTPLVLAQKNNCILCIIVLRYMNVKDKKFTQ